MFTDVSKLIPKYVGPQLKLTILLQALRKQDTVPESLPPERHYESRNKLFAHPLVPIHI